MTAHAPSEQNQAFARRGDGVQNRHVGPRDGEIDHGVVGLADGALHLLVADGVVHGGNEEHGEDRDAVDQGADDERRQGRVQDQLVRAVHREDGADDVRDGVADVLSLGIIR